MDTSTDRSPPQAFPAPPSTPQWWWTAVWCGGVQPASGAPQIVVHEQTDGRLIADATLPRLDGGPGAIEVEAVVLCT